MVSCQLLFGSDAGGWKMSSSSFMCLMVMPATGKGDVFDGLQNWKKDSHCLTYFEILLQIVPLHRFF